MAGNTLFRPEDRLVWYADWLKFLQEREADLRTQLARQEKSARKAEPPPEAEIAFVSDRDANAQVYVMPVAGGEPRRITRHTEGYRIEDWYPDGEALLVSSARDHHWRSAQRFFRLPLEGEETDLRSVPVGKDHMVLPGDLGDGGPRRSHVFSLVLG